ncbi:50S ribosomal protein L11 methyltransferase [Clostridium sp. D2Q-11]|uniref:Ribosomal protein L11 methyltransferase n=1 Tax=Anaeromonas frigoriresistens TaxID=2683708 RepID=A0A942UQU5_9FIRM|nr:50S ribosomal protein L11 methyltransferase [Anaeromonas frigoriresistens]MBS4536878.1 50S ribosomal protein L11 methyltransferase [Anaeromonas frigoriresistens]
MKWIEVQIKTTTEAVETVTNILYESGAEGLVIEDPNDITLFKSDEGQWDYIDPSLMESDFEGAIVKGYFEESEDLIDKIELIKQNIEKIPSYNLDKGLGEVTTSEIEEQDWSETWRKYYKPKKIGEKVVIKPTWEPYEKADDEVIIELDPGMAFGTGTHETTMMCVRELEKYIHQFDTVFDVGCGTGILAIAAAKLGAVNTIAIDLDEDSVKVASQNIKKNGVANTVQVKHGNLLDVVDGRANVVVANIIADVIKILAKDIKRFMEDDGVFIASGIILDKIREVRESLEDNGLKVIEEIKLGEWACLVSKIGVSTDE